MAGETKAGVKSHCLLLGLSISVGGGMGKMWAGAGSAEGRKEQREVWATLPVLRSSVLPPLRGYKLPENFLPVASTFLRPGFKPWLCAQ